MKDERGLQICQAPFTASIDERRFLWKTKRLLFNIPSAIEILHIMVAQDIQHILISRLIFWRMQHRKCTFPDVQPAEFRQIDDEDACIEIIFQGEFQDVPYIRQEIRHQSPKDSS